MDRQKNQFNKVANEWLSFRKEEVKKTTYYRYEAIVVNHLIPQFSAMSIEDIGNIEVQNYINFLAENLKYHTVESIYNVLKNIMQFAGNKDFIRWRDLRMKKEKYTIDVLTEIECRRINKELEKGYNLKDLGILLALNTGLRIGEVCGIRWEDINLRKKSIDIKHTVQRVSTGKENGAKTKVELFAPKSDNSMREVAIPEFIYEILKEKECAVLSQQTFLLSGKLDKTIEPRTMSRYFERRCTKILGRSVKFHNLRHTYATLSISNGVDAKIVSEMLGHGSVVTTLKFYRNVGFNEKFNGVRALESVIGV